MASNAYPVPVRVLLTGGAGFIGIHTALALVERGHEVVIVDDLSNSRLEAVRRLGALAGRPVPFVLADARDEAALSAAFAEHAPVDAVVHLAGLKSVGESLRHPVRYYDINIGSTIALLKTMEAHGVATLVFSSSATVYGAPEALPISETDFADRPLPSPYGRSKRFIEHILSDAAAADSSMRIVALRYFNPVGAHESGLIGEDPNGTPSNLMPYVARVAAGLNEFVSIFGNDYDTPDGTGLRDYIHVVDLAHGHVAALERARAGFSVFNLGTGVPVSVLELIHAYEAESGREVRRRFVDRRAGDVAASYCDPQKANDELQWRATKTVRDACRDSWRWQSLNPDGYRRSLSG